eukprot:GFUD01020355.1.p1 GENE.GFUD01020355.1~~GFUD01020355.1.p1  ORF type:complete len:152 (-),score=23.85 GFUD01020355.1:84-500(-)
MTMLLSLGIIKADFTTEESTHAVEIDQVNEDNSEAKLDKLLILTPLVTILYFSVLLGIILLSIILSYRRNIGRMYREERRRIVIEMKNLDRPPSYTRVYFSEDPPEYRDIESSGDKTVVEPNWKEAKASLDDVYLISL